MTSCAATIETKATPETRNCLRGLQVIKCHLPANECPDCCYIRNLDSKMTKGDLVVLAYHCLHDIFDFHVGVAQGCAVGRRECLYLSDAWNRFDEIVGALIGTSSIPERDNVITDFEQLISDCWKDIERIEAEYRQQMESQSGALARSTEVKHGGSEIHHRGDAIHDATSGWLVGVQV